jgi:hypothetical protein
MKRFSCLSLLLLVFVLCSVSCSKNDTEKVDYVKQYSSLLYGKWCRENQTDISYFFMSYTFSTNSVVTRYERYANKIHDKWVIETDETTEGEWFVQYERGIVGIMIKWDGKDSFRRYTISHIDNSILSFSDGYTEDLSKGSVIPKI